MGRYLKATAMALVMAGVMWTVALDDWGALRLLLGPAGLVLVIAGLLLVVLGIRKGWAGIAALRTFPNWWQVAALFGFHLACLGVESSVSFRDMLSPRVVLVMTGVVGPALAMSFLFLPEQVREKLSRIDL